MKWPLRSLCALMLAAAGTAGCSTYPTDRIAAHQAEFDSWPPDVQQKVRAGVVAAGFTQEQVFIALGPPNRKIMEGPPGNVTEIWLYWRHASRLAIGIGGMSVGRSSAVGGSISTGGIKLGQDVGGRVVFTNGLLTQAEVMTR